VANLKNAFPLADAGRRLAAFALIGTGLFAAPLLVEHIDFGDATRISAIARDSATTLPAPVAVSRRIDMAWELETRRSRDMAVRDVAPERLDRIPPRIMLALR
jgi:hypothetical protein